ncbi:MAG: hypothetical protein H0U76_22480 [Ktedonobacteraceae bacterium]|nr:hypothetical protein [Ktedonobacteraceae bacterium]
MSVTYHLFTPTATSLALIADYILAGDGIYGVLDRFGMRIPVPLVSCELRGLPPLAPWLHGTVDVATEMQALPEEFDFGPSYHILTEDHPLIPLLNTGRVYQYIIAREGVFLLAGCTGLEVLMPISHGCVLPGLASVTPDIRFSYPRVGEDIVLTILERSKAAQDDASNAIERLFYLLWEGQWHLHEPAQDAGREHVRAKQVTPEYLATCIEGHSHHSMRAYFSHGDNQAEVRDGGFRIYFVLGRIFSHPELRVRICIHGYSWEIPASSFFVLPAGIADCVAKEWGRAA